MPSLLLTFYLFSGNTICSLGITFLQDGKEYSFDIQYDTEKKIYVYEKFSEILKDKYGNETVEIWLEKDILNKRYYSKDENILETIPRILATNILINGIDTSDLTYLGKMKNILIGFASKIDIINMNNIPMENTIKLMKNKNNMSKKVVNFIKDSDLYMDNFEYVDMENVQIPSDFKNEQIDENVLHSKETLMEQVRLVSTYKGVKVPSLLFDSTGTKKIAALASYIIEALEEGRILIIDELDSSIHFTLTRSIVAMFNNGLNTKAQMIFTVHDINLMDCMRLFRKEQIWFVHKDNKGVYVYSLADFTSRDGIRDTTDIIDKYRKGFLGAIPEPELINSLIDIAGNKAKETPDEE